MDIRHVVVLMLENRSFDSMLGMLYQSGAGFDGLTGNESNIWHKPDGSQQAIGVWTDPVAAPRALYIPDPDPGELFDDIRTQINGLGAGGSPAPGPPAMSGFVDNYVRQPATAADPYPVMHYFGIRAQMGPRSFIAVPARCRPASRTRHAPRRLAESALIAQPRQACVSRLPRCRNFLCQSDFWEFSLAALFPSLERDSAEGCVYMAMMGTTSCRFSIASRLVLESPPLALASFSRGDTEAGERQHA